MAKLICRDIAGFTFETVFGRRYCVPFGVELRPRNPMARKGGHLAALRVDDDGVSNPLAQWGTKPRGCSALASLEKDYDLSGFVVVGEPLAAEVVARPAAEDAAPPDDVPTVAIQRTESFLGWPVAFAGDEPLIEDEELGRRLGYSRPRDVRGLIEQIFNKSELRALPPQSLAGRRARRYALTERQAVKVCLRADTKLASVIQDEVIEVFLAVRHGRTAAPAPSDPWSVLQSMAAGTLELRTQVVEAKESAQAAQATADEAKAIAEQARTLAGSRGVLDAIVGATPPGASSETPDGAWSSKPQEGYRSMRALARAFSLPCNGAGAKFVSQVARALGVQDDATAVARQDVVIGGRARRQHITYGPIATDRLGPALRFAFGRMTDHGYHAPYGVLQPRPGFRATRSRAFVLAEMLAAATAGAEGVRPVEQAEQQTVPGFEERRAG